MRYERILLPTDLSRFGELAAKEALEHLKAKGVLRMVHVVQPQYTVMGTVDGGIPIYDAALTKERMGLAKRHLERLARKLGPRAAYEVLVGADPAPLLVAYARRSKASLMVLSTHGRSGLGRILFGSMAQKLMRLYPGPMLLLRPAKRRAP